MALLLICFRLAYLSLNEEIATVAKTQGTRTITVATARGTIFDRNMQPLVNAENQYYATILPEQRLLEHIRPNTDPSEYQRAVKQLSKQTPALVRLTEPSAITEGLRMFMAPNRYGSYCPCVHLIGHLDSGGADGVSGLEKAYNQQLNRFRGLIQVRYFMNGVGRYMESNEPPEVTNTMKNSSGGIQLSIDRSVQTIVDECALQYITKGNVVILDAATGGVLASSSFPTFRPDAVNESVQADDGSLVNRLFSLYDCGSVFKIITAAAAMESGVSVDQCYTCTGAMQVEDTTFHCHLRTGHELLNMKEAFAQSCNLYFIQLAQQIGPQAILDTAKRLGLMDSVKLADGMEAPMAIFPSESDLTADAAVANLSFGQGELLVSPLHVAQFTSVIASGGLRLTPYLVEGFVDKAGGIKPIKDKRGGEMVLSPYTVENLQEMMKMVVTDGTGKRAQPERVDAAGKTGTAQTGQLSNGKPVIQNWFTGYFPAENPAYIITIVAEDAQNNGGDAVGLFCEISNKLS